MKIESSSVNMASERTYSSVYSKQSASIVTTEDKAAVLDFSDESKTLMQQMEENQKKLLENDKEKNKNNLQNQYEQLKNIFEQKKANMNTGWVGVNNDEDFNIQILRRILASLRAISGGKGKQHLQKQQSAADGLKRVNQDFNEMMRGVIRGTNSGADVPFRMPGADSAANAGAASGSVAVGVNRTVWTKTTVTSAFYAETENTAYKANGVVKTADGREINFGVTLEMSRAFCQNYEELTQSSYIVTDPLIINLDTDTASVTDKKFLFDLDSDGKEEEISFAGKGSGFLALDKNGDGKINDGSELFGTKSGDGFKDLAKYDIDGNGWIDENDDVFKDLKVWTKDAYGNDKLIDLKEAGVGAIYLGHTSTQFSLNEQTTNQTNAIIQATGVYLKEDGGVGTIQHVDLAI